MATEPRALARWSAVEPAHSQVLSRPSPQSTRVSSDAPPCVGGSDGCARGVQAILQTCLIV